MQASPNTPATDALQSSAEAARQAECDARLAVNAIKTGADRAGTAAAATASATYLSQHDYEGARARSRAASIARIAAEDALPAHEWEGRKVSRTGKIYRRFGGGIVGEKRFEGIVETVRSTSVFAANVRYNIPPAGSVIVRMLKKDGSPGLSFEGFSDWNGAPRWTLAEVAQDEPK